MTGIRMSTALLNGEQIMASEVTRRQVGYCCDDCKTSVSFVNQHVVRKDDPDLARIVPAFFRLMQGAFHQTDCKYTPFGQVDQLVKRANAVEDGGENPFVLHAPGDPIEFRLNIATDAKRGLYDPKDGKDAGKKYAERVALLWSGETLAKYCRSATGLAKIWREMESGEGRNELKDIVCFTHLGQELNWDDFFFGFERYSSLRKRVADKSLQHPVATVIHVKEVGDEFPFIRTTAQRNGRSKGDTRISIAVQAKQHLLKRFRAGRYYIIFGDFYYSGGRDYMEGDMKRPIHYQNIGISLHHAAQFCEIENPEDPNDRD